MQKVGSGPLVGLSLLGLAAIAGAGCEALGFRDDSYHPAIAPASFKAAAVTNPYFPLIPGTTLKFIEKKDGRTSEQTFAVTRDTKLILGVKCIVVRDTVTQDGVVKEDTLDWFAEDKQGTVWYFGEDTKEFLPNGKVSTEGSWEAGVDGAEPGIVMPGKPAAGTPPYRQEYYHGHAEDMGEVVALDESVKVPCGAFTACVRTDEWSMLESGGEKKWYAKGVGLVRTESEDGEVSELVSVARPR